MSCQVTTARQAANIYRARHLGRSETPLSSLLLSSPLPTQASILCLPHHRLKGNEQGQGDHAHTQRWGGKRDRQTREGQPRGVCSCADADPALFERARAGGQPSYYLSPASIPMPTYTPHLRRAAKPPPAFNTAFLLLAVAAREKKSKLYPPPAVQWAAAAAAAAAAGVQCVFPVIMMKGGSTSEARPDSSAHAPEHAPNPENKPPGRPCLSSRRRIAGAGRQAEWRLSHRSDAHLVRQWDVGASRARWAARTMPARYLPNSTYPPRVLISFNYLLTTYGARTHTERYADASRLALPATLAVAIPPACLPDRRPPCLMRPAVSAPADAVVVGEPPCPNRTCQAPRGRLPRLRRVAPAAPRLVSSCFSRSGLDQSHWALRGESTTQRPCIFSRPAAPGRRRGKSPLAPSRAVTRDTDSKGSRSDD
ncbi:hypothetical protein Purlil1_2344 [Purpureocillium lilacinum]|uniref:Uncharacterized protein n=1 Tax=Purpureocillium lilacinum TaxID=33203 RepID=A0ABR0C9W0_PURLI|nr:hypothetical protein Purlil1_2344 [Purpureocillium lilacinum]